jgi:hypothetical protein
MPDGEAMQSCAQGWVAGQESAQPSVHELPCIGCGAQRSMLGCKRRVGGAAVGRHLVFPLLQPMPMLAAA